VRTFDTVSLDHGSSLMHLSNCCVQIVQLYYAFKLSTLYSSRLRIGLVSSIALFAAAQLGALNFNDQMLPPAECCTLNRIALGIVAIYTSVHSPVPLFSMSVHHGLGWQSLSYLVCTVVCVSRLFLSALEGGTS